ncbi:aldehyde dehydrogenase family protein [Pseudonocardia sp. C8]|uniref:aldehyde dehydrogenase family protein n=1 Tax=Pseudonocardia sp. C8 TaxID=2762759 RepID=UPI0016424E08|nr:aldehyde dehydrogenase family protein [Pseudonocardia sp. C8]
MRTDVAGVPVPHLGSAYVGGDWVSATGPTRPVVSPASGRVVTEAVLPSVDEARAALDRASGPEGRAWSATEVSRRVAVCRRFCDALERRFDDMGAVWAVEAGMPVRYSRTLHRFGAAGAWRAALDSAEDALRDERRDSPLGEVLVRREPAGVVAAVMAFNGPLVTVASKVVPALLAGCPVVVKAAPESQLVMRLVAECAADAGVPAGALSILCSEVDVAREITADPRVALVSLTGGRAAAQEIIDATRQRFARTHLELGGKSAALVLDDAPVDAVLRSLVPGATGGAGQVCALLSRILVPESRHDELVAALGTAWESLPMGDPLDPATAVGPLISAAARERTEGFVERAVADGARIVCGGRRPPGLDAGYFLEPTLLSGASPDSEIVRREVFGPVTVVQSFRDLEEGIRLAEDTEYGLAATVYTRDRDLAMDVAGRLTVGSVAINTFGPTVTAPFGGRKCSGWGREGGPEGIREFTELKQIVTGP